MKRTYVHIFFFFFSHPLILQTLPIDSPFKSPSLRWWKSRLPFYRRLQSLANRNSLLIFNRKCVEPKVTPRLRKIGFTEALI